MKKIIAAIIRVIMPKAVRQHENTKSIQNAKHIHNAVVMQSLLDKEHSIRDSYNKEFDTVYTTKKALKEAYKRWKTGYNSAVALYHADFR